MAQQRKVFVGGVPQDFSQDDLYAAFSSYADVKKAWLQKGHVSGGSPCAPQNHRGFGFVIFHDPLAIDGLLGGSMSRFISLRNGHQIEVKRAVSSVKIHQAKEDNVEPAPFDGMKLRDTNNPIVNTGASRQIKAGQQTKRADAFYVQWPAKSTQQPALQLEAPWMSGVESNVLAQPPMMHFSQQASQWPWPSHAHADVGALMTDAFHRQYASGLDLMPQHIPVRPDWPRHGPGPGQADSPQQREPRHAARALHGTREDMRPTPEKPGWLNASDLFFAGPRTPQCLLAPGRCLPDPIGFGADGGRCRETALRREVLSAASPARPGLSGARPGLPPGLEDLRVPHAEHENPPAVQYDLI